MDIVIEPDIYHKTQRGRSGKFYMGSVMMHSITKNDVLVITNMCDVKLKNTITYGGMCRLSYWGPFLEM
jgi:hypothetical protein